MNELALFAGAGGGILGGHLLGWRTVCAVEWEPYAACVLAARQNDGLLPPFPIWDDVQTFDGKPWRGIVDVVSGGFPCQDISAAGKGAGIDGQRSGMWKEMARIIGEVRPRFVFVENSPMLTSRGLGTVLGDLASMGFDAEWGVISAADTGAPHLRERIWVVGTNTQQRGLFSYPELQWNGRREQQPESIEETDGNVANAKSFRDRRKLRWIYTKNEAQRQSKKYGKNQTAKFNDGSKNVANTNGAQCKGNQCTKRSQQKYTDFSLTSRWPTEPDVGRVADGVAARVDRLKAIGNGQVPRVAATAFELLRERLNES
jgi:DNA (cytosine-5)-methyltransferase 1